MATKKNVKKTAKQTKSAASTAKAVTKTSARRSKTTAKKATRTRVVDEARDRKIVAACKKGVTTYQFVNEMGVYTSGSMLSNLRPIARRHNLKIKQEGTKGKYVYKFVGAGK